ncbi:MAG: EamA family transporter [Actinobacteria bacterium]|uniref:Unannotated protein n=1 Tax=freshwater metagenome TaxID=449393 RepID=A0A6J5ZB67_9ZZZZ|nr:EamA family transporter [Actinomycetota bacterium]
MPVVLALISSVIWGLADFLGGTLSRRRHAIAVLVGAQPFGLLAAAICVSLFGQWTFSTNVIVNGALAGTFGLIGLVAFYTALGSGRMGIVSPISSLGVLLPLGVGLARGDRPTATQLIGVVIAIVGVVLASGPELSGGAPARPVFLAITAAVFFGFGVFFMSLGGQENPGVTVVVMRITQVALLLIAINFIGDRKKLSLSDLPLLIAIGVTDAVANVFYTTAAQMGMLSLVSVVGSIFPVFTVILAWWILKERLQMVQYLGIAATLCGVTAISVGG